MAISAKALWIVLGFIGVAAVTNLSLGHFPLMRHVTGRAIYSSVGRSKMELTTL